MPLLLMFITSNINLIRMVFKMKIKTNAYKPIFITNVSIQIIPYMTHMPVNSNLTCETIKFGPLNLFLCSQYALFHFMV